MGPCQIGYSKIVFCSLVVFISGIYLAYQFRGQVGLYLVVRVPLMEAIFCKYKVYALTLCTGDDR